ncbi:MAG: hypothetical protein U0359_19550 [Byssovorax sp.]
MLRSHLLVTCVATLSLAGLAALSSACGGGGTGGSTSGTGGGSTEEHAAPPGPGPTKEGDGSGSVTLAISKLYLGDTNRDGTPNKVNGWKQYGYDLDGQVSTVDSKNLCKPRNNAPPKNVYPDGDKGIDNSFGKNILGIILGIAADAPVKVNQGIADGKFTIMLDMAKLGSGSDYNPILTKLYGGADLGAAPKFDGSDKWPVIQELLNNPADIGSAKVQFPNSYVTGNTWVSGSKGDLVLSLSVQGFTLNLTIGSALISAELSGDHKTAKNGTIAGILATDVLTSELKKVAGAFDPSLCSGPTVDSIVSQIEQASDILADGSQDPNKDCDGISIGLGFDAAVVQLGDIAPKGDPKPDPCMGSGGGGGAM